MAPTSVDHHFVANVATSQSLIAYLSASDRKKTTLQNISGVFRASVQTTIALVFAGRASNLSNV